MEFLAEITLRKNWHANFNFHYLKLKIFNLNQLWPLVLLKPIGNEHLILLLHLTEFGFWNPYQHLTTALSESNNGIRFLNLINIHIPCRSASRRIQKILSTVFTTTQYAIHIRKPEIYCRKHKSHNIHFRFIDEDGKRGKKLFFAHLREEKRIEDSLATC